MLRRFPVALTLLLTLIAGGAQGQVDEYQVKAAFLYNFARFVEWPPDAFKSPSDPITVCILGQNPFGGSLEQVMSGKTVDGRAFAIHQAADAQSACNCHIAFVSASEGKQIRSIMDGLRGAGVLTVGETPGFATDGGVINFRLENGRLRFEININAAERQHLRLSSKLLSLAQIVRR